MSQIVQLPYSLVKQWQEETESATIVHCSYFSLTHVKLRVWRKRTLLVDNNGIRVRLHKPFNIELSIWTLFKPVYRYCRFTLLFEALSKDCTSLQLIEEEPAKGLLCSDWIARNSTDVYNIELHKATE